jgi:Ni,Fe-hydrogenase III small subunit/ferredoxin
MLGIIAERLSQRGATIRFPEDADALLPAKYRGRPEISSALCAADCSACAEACPTNAIVIENGKVRLDLGSCLFCGECARVCPQDKISFTREYRMAVRRRENLWIEAGANYDLAAAYEDARFRKSFRIRQVSAGGSGAEEAEIAVLSTVVFDVARWGIQVVASPRHADAIAVTGPVSNAMKEALHITYDAVPAPKLVIAVGASAISGGAWRGRPEVADGGVTHELPVDLFIPGFPPHPLTILDGLLRLLNRLGGGTE